MSEIIYFIISYYTIFSFSTIFGFIEKSSYSFVASITTWSHVCDIYACWNCVGMPVIKKDDSRDPGIVRNIILKLILQKWDGTRYTGFLCLRKGQFSRKYLKFF